MSKHLVSAAVLSLLAAALAAQGVAVTSPNGGETWFLGSPHAISWRFQNAGAVKVSLILRNGGGVVGTIKSNIDLSAGAWQWAKVGTLENGAVVPPGNDYVVRIRDAGNSFGDSSDGRFSIARSLAAGRHATERPPSLLARPKLAVTEIDLAPNAEGFGIVFNYKDVGNGALPKAVGATVKPTYRVLLDGKETASGTLFIPVFSAPPGWEQKGCFGGWIVLPAAGVAADSRWHIGNTIAVYINENKAMGMESHSLSLPMKPIAMKYKFDLVRNGAALDWDRRVLTVYLRLDGKVPPGRELFVYAGRYPSDDGYFLSRQPAKPGTYGVSKKVDFPRHYTRLTFYLNSFVTIPNTRQVEDMDYRNQYMEELTFVRPDPNPQR